MRLTRNCLFFSVLLFLSGCEQGEPLSFAGYSYGEFIYLSLPFTEEIEQVLVDKGDRVKKGQELIKMADYSAQNALHIAEERVQAEKSRLNNLETGERQAALEVIIAQLAQAKTAAGLATRQLARKRDLYQQKLISTAEWEKIKAEHAQKTARVKELSHQLKLKKLPARQDEINQQKSLIQSAKLQRDQARWDLQQRILRAPQDAMVYNLLYQSGERPLAGKPIVMLLPPQNIKLRFYVPEKRLGEIHIGDKVKINCDGCKKPLYGHIKYISAQAEYSPPVIYSTQRREKLLFMAEAVPVKADAFFIKPGQPVEVEAVVDE